MNARAWSFARSISTVTLCLFIFSSPASGRSDDELLDNLDLTAFESSTSEPYILIGDVRTFEPGHPPLDLEHQYIMLQGSTSCDVTTIVCGLRANTTVDCQADDFAIGVNDQPFGGATPHAYVTRPVSSELVLPMYFVFYRVDASDPCLPAWGRVRSSERPSLIYINEEFRAARESDLEGLLLHNGGVENSGVPTGGDPGALIGEDSGGPRIRLLGRP